MNFGMFGLPKRPIGTGGVFGGEFEDEPYAQQPQPQSKRWLDGGKFGFKDGLALALGAIGDARTGRPMTSQMILGSIQQRKAQEYAEQQRKQAMQDQKELLNYKAGLPQAAPNNDTVNDYNFWKSVLSPAEFEQWKMNNHINPTFYTGADGRRYPSQVTPVLPSSPVGKLTPIR